VALGATNASSAMLGVWPSNDTIMKSPCSAALCALILIWQFIALTACSQTD
jgi:hypothetical protein